jgi:fatty-acyl-CoA synthase
MDTFGEVLYNLYGSTEVAWASIASPRQLRAAPGTAGTPPHGTRLRLIDGEGREVRDRERTGRIFVSNEMVMDGYTTGDGRTVLDGLIATGDVGHLDSEGRLFVSGRDDEMIISGGENVFPREVEDLLAEHPAIADVAVVGVEDREFGQRLRAFVVLEPGTELDGDAVRSHVRDNLARFKVPRDVLFVEDLPRTATGKVIKRVLDHGEVQN